MLQGISKSTTCLSVDPGAKFMGYAVLRTTYELLAHGTIIPRSRLVGLDRQLYLISRLQDLIAEWQPATVAYEEYTWRSADDGEGRYVLGRPAMERLIGGIQVLALWPPYPVVMGLLPGVWGKQLVGNTAHTKVDVACAVNLRLGTDYDGGHYTNHESDAVGIGIVALDNLAMQTAMGK